jgi:hypothetical protein
MDEHTLVALGSTLTVALSTMRSFNWLYRNHSFSALGKHELLFVIKHTNNPKEVGAQKSHVFCVHPPSQQNPPLPQ